MPGRLALVPTEARDFVAAFEQARDDRLSFDEMIDVCAEEIAALECWRAQITLSVASARGYGMTVPANSCGIFQSRTQRVIPICAPQTTGDDRRSL